MRRLLLPAVLVCALAIPASAGGTYEGGNDEPICPPGVECPVGGGTNSADPALVSIIVDVVPFIVSALL